MKSLTFPDPNASLSFRWSLRDAAGAWPAGCRVIEPEVARGRPQSLPPPKVLGLDRQLRLTAPQGTLDRSLVVFERAQLIARNGLIALDDGTVLAEPAWHRDIVDLWLRRPPRELRHRRRHGRWFSCLLEYAYNYYHWVCEVLPRFHRVLDRLPADTRLVVPPRMAAWQWDSLAAIGIDRTRCESWPVDECWEIDELHYAPPVAVCGDHDPDAARWVSDTVLAALRVRRGGLSRLYVTRRRTRRTIVNELDLWPMFQKAGFEMIETETMTFADQVRTFAAARCVIAPHGAGLANVLWSASPATVVEIFSPAYASQRCIWGLASAFGHRYAAAVAENAAARGRNIRWHRDLVRQILDWALA